MTTEFSHPYSSAARIPHGGSTSRAVGRRLRLVGRHDRAHPVAHRRVGPGFASELAVLSQQFDTVVDPEALLHLIAVRAHSLIPDSGFAALRHQAHANWSVAIAADVASRQYAELHAAFNREASISVPSRGNAGQSASSCLEVRSVRPDAQLAHHGLSHIVIAPFGTPRAMFGTFNWYLRDEPDRDLLDTARCFARHASLAYLHARERQQLNRAVESRGWIGQAQGILMAQLGLDADAAFTVLRRESQHTNTRLRVVARRVIITNSLPADTRTTPVSMTDFGFTDGSGGSRTEWEAALDWLESSASLTPTARLEALQGVIVVLAAELDAHAGQLRTDQDVHDLVADGVAHAATIVRDTAHDVCPDGAA